MRTHKYREGSERLAVVALLAGLALIGISAGTTAFAVVVDDSTGTKTDKSLKEASDQIEKLKKDVAAAVVKSSPKEDIEEMRRQWHMKEQEIMTLAPLLTPESKGCWNDILSFGGSDTALHRMQIIGWTAVFSAIFLVETYRALSMPEFSADLLGLMGISSGTYVGFKAVTQGS